MKILHFNCMYYKSFFESEIIEEFKFNMNPHVIHYSFISSGYIKELSDKEKKFVTIVKSDSKFLRTNYLVFLRMKKIWDKIQKMNSINLGDYDYTYSHFLFTDGYLSYRCKQKFDIPYIVTIRNTDINDKLRWTLPFIKKIAISILLNANTIIVKNLSTENKLKRLIPEVIYGQLNYKIKFIPNGMDDFWIKNATKTPKMITDNKRIKILTVGDINKNKNQLLVCESAQKLIDEGFVIEYYIAGRTVDEKVLSALKKYDFVSYLGVLNKEELISVYKSSDIFVMPSITETFGNVYLESMTQGVPIIYSKDQGIYGVFDDGFVGQSVNPQDSNSCCLAIKYIIENYQNMSKNCINCSLQFSWSNVVSSIRNLL